MAKKKQNKTSSQDNPVQSPKPKQAIEPKKSLSTGKSKPWAGYLLALLAFLLYSNTLGHQFAFDDAIVISENQFTQRGTAGIKDLMTRDFFEGIYGEGEMELSGGRYRPLSMVMFAFENQLFGTPKKMVNGQPLKDNKGRQLYEYPVQIGHFINILLYALSAFLLYIVLSNWFEGSKGLSSAIPFMAGLLFVAHPIHTEVVANIKSRDEILALLLLLFSYLQIHKTAKGNSSTVGMILGVAAFFGAMLSKETAFTFILLFPATLFVLYKELNWGQIAKISAPYWIAAVLYFVLRSAMVGGVAAETNTDLMENPFFGVAMGQKLATIALILWYYIQLLLFPHPLSSDYSREQIPLVGFDHPLAILGLVLYVGMAVWVLWKLWKRDEYALFILLYFIPLSLTTNILFNIGAPMAERFLYIPSLGFCLAIAFALQQLFKIESLVDLQKRLLVMVGLGIVTTVFSLKTFSRNPDWYNNLTLFSSDVKSSPNSAKMNYYYANTVFKQYLDKAQHSEADKDSLAIAEKHFARAVEIYPRFHTSLYNLGFINLLKKDGKKAEEYFLKTLAIMPGHILSIEQLGRVYGELLQNFPEAEKYLLQSIAINKQRNALGDLSNNYQHLGIVYAMQAKYEPAIQVYLEAIKLQPNNANNYLNLGITYQQLGQNEKAQEMLNKAFELDPNLRQQQN